MHAGPVMSGGGPCQGDSESTRSISRLKGYDPPAMLGPNHAEGSGWRGHTEVLWYDFR